jgi:UDP-2-acetamido-3-amino-2,3-dideoxy-glucuronate N-acetyltransferase
MATVNGPAAIHPTAQIHETCVVWPFANVCAGVRMGPHGAIGSTVYIGANTVLGEGVRINGGAHITDHMTIGDRVFIGPNVTFVNDRHPKALNPGYKRESPVVEDFVSIGGGATILPGVRLGAGCVIGAGAVVTKDVPPGETWVGNPAREIRRAYDRDALAVLSSALPADCVSVATNGREVI